MSDETDVDENPDLENTEWDQSEGNGLKLEMVINNYYDNPLVSIKNCNFVFYYRLTLLFLG